MCHLGHLHNEELHDPCWSPSIVRVMKSRRVQWGETECIHNFSEETCWKTCTFETEKQNGR
jgi:hypothetical protein